MTKGSASGSGDRYDDATLPVKPVIKEILLALTGLVPLLSLTSTPRDPLPMVYTFFVIVTFFRKCWPRNDAARLPGPVRLHLFCFILLTGLALETLAWLSNFLAQEKEPALLHPQLVPDLILAAGFYSGIALAWVIVTRWFRFTPGAAFLITGFMGVGFEQLGAVLVMIAGALLTNPLLAILMAVYLLMIYGPISGVAMTLLAERLPGNSVSWWRFPLVLVLMMVLAAAGTMLVNGCAMALGGLPEKQSIVEHPLW